MRTIFVIVPLVARVLCGCGSSGSPAGSGTVITPADFKPLCDSSQVDCDTAAMPPNLVGRYTGQGQTIQTTNALWAVGDMNTFDADITAQNGSTLSGTFDMGTLHLDIADGQVRGTAQSFTIYGTDVFMQDNCNLEVRGIIQGAPSSSASAMALTGKLVLSFTDNISGSGCTADQKTNYPGTGAVFSYTAMPAP